MDWGNARQLTWTIFGYIFVIGFFDDVISDYLWARSVLLTSPTVAAVGLTMTIPMALFVDYFTVTVTLKALIGAACVLVGFVVVNIDCGMHAHRDNHRNDAIVS
jgi:solute carrier family 35, member F5